MLTKAGKFKFNYSPFSLTVQGKGKKVSKTNPSRWVHYRLPKGQTAALFNSVFLATFLTGRLEGESYNVHLFKGCEKGNRVPTNRERLSPAVSMYFKDISFIWSTDVYSFYHMTVFLSGSYFVRCGNFANTSCLLFCCCTIFH